MKYINVNCLSVSYKNNRKVKVDAQVINLTKYIGLKGFCEQIFETSIDITRS
jgi:hypothetical protein